MSTVYSKTTGVKVNMTAKGSGEALAQINAENTNPKTDIWFGGTGDPHLQAAEQGLTLEYKSAQHAQLHPWAQKQAADSGYRPVGVYLGPLGFGYNKVLLAKRDLDARLRREMREEIRALQQRLSLTVAYVTHDQSEAMAVSDQIIVMEQGLISQRGTPRELYEAPGSEFVAGFMGEAALFPGTSRADGLVQLGPLVLRPRVVPPAGPVKVAVRPEAWRIARQPESAALAARLSHMAYLGGVHEYTFDTALGQVFAVSCDLDDVLGPGDEVYLTLGVHGVSVFGRPG
jgi:hypothetical protein